jgi:hypothetical protein
MEINPFIASYDMIMIMIYVHNRTVAVICGSDGNFTLLF